MNFKIENKYLDITNYPSVAKYLEVMAGKGWLIHKVFVGNIFIFKKIKPQELEFSISPYEIETAFTRKTKKELDEFKDVTQSVGWKYCTKSYNLHIYYKEKHVEALDIHTDEEEEFKLLENTSFLIPRSYEYTSRGSYTDEIRFLETEYSKALTAGLARELMNRYKEEAVKNIGRHYSPHLEYSYEAGRVDGILLDLGLTISDFEELRQEDLKVAVAESIKRMKRRTITRADHVLWNVDEAYFLTGEQDTIVLRKGKEVFFLRGNDFADLEVITIAKKKLKL